jgi:hypothetical protein
MSVPFLDYKISLMSKMAEKNHELLKDMNSFFETISDTTIREYYSKHGETMFDLELNYFRVNVSDNLERITKMKENPLSINLNRGQIKQLNESEKLAEDSLKILDNIENIIKNIMELKPNNRLNNVIMGPKLEDLSRATVMEYNIPPEDYMQSAVLHQEYPGRDKQYDGHGGFHNRKNKTKNKKYTKKRTTYKRPKKRVSKKNKTRKIPYKYHTNTNSSVGRFN